MLDKWDVFHCRLFRESCVFHRGNYVKDLGRLGRELHKIIIVDNSPASYFFHPENAVILMRNSAFFYSIDYDDFVLLTIQVPVASWFDDMNDRELLDLIPFLEQLSKVDSVYAVLQSNHKPFQINVTGASSAPAPGQAPVGSSTITSVTQPLLENNSASGAKK